MRLRSTALPTCRVTVKPNRGSCPSAGRPPILVTAFLGLEHERRRCPARTLADAQKLGAPFQGRHARRCAFCCLRPCPGHWPPIAAGRHLTPRGACGPWHAGAPRPCGRRSSPCACGSRAGACARACSADRYVSRLVSVAASPLQGRAEVSAAPAARPRARDCKLRSEPIGSCRAYRVGPSSSQSDRQPTETLVQVAQIHQFFSLSLTYA